MGNEEFWRKLKKREARGKRKITLPESFPKEMSNHLLLNDKSQSSGSGIVCGLFLMRKYPSLAEGLYGQGCGQWECSLGAIISLLLFLSLISNKNRMKRTWLREKKKKMHPGQTRATVHHGWKIGGNTRDQVEAECSLRLCLFSVCEGCTRSHQEANLCWPQCLCKGYGDLPHALAFSLSPGWGHIRHTATRNLWASFPQGLPPTQSFLGKHLMLQRHWCWILQRCN